MSLALRPLLAAAAAAAVLAYGAGGHHVPPPNAHDGMVGSTVGLCLLVVTVLGISRLRRPAQQPRPMAVPSVCVPRPSPAAIPVDGRARASPRFLRRFLN